MDFEKNRGCFGFLAGFLTLAAFGGLGAFLESLGVEYAPLIGIVGLVAAVVMGVAVARRAGWALRVSGLAVLIAGVLLTSFALFVFGQYLLTGEGAAGTTPENFGTGMFVLVATGVGMAGGGLLLALGRVR